jgi:hypothetical protein
MPAVAAAPSFCELWLLLRAVAAAQSFSELWAALEQRANH